VKFSHIPAFYPRVDASEAIPLTHADLGLPEDAHIYACTQNLRKIHPGMDMLFRSILERDGKGWILLVQYGTPQTAAALMERLGRSLGAAISRVKMLGHMERGHYLGLLARADALLDTSHYGGGQTSYDAIGMGAPIVTLPGATMRSRSTAAMLKAIGVEDTVASSAAEYAEKAVRIACDKAAREALSARIREGHGVLYENQAVIDEHIAFFRRIVN
jgi:predicted O-linked N-acetylglucosamine transferase (SPINDLY family)